MIFRNIIKLHVQITFLNSDTLLSEQKKYEKYVYFYELSRIPSTRLSHLYMDPIYTKWYYDAWYYEDIWYVNLEKKVEYWNGYYEATKALNAPSVNRWRDEDKVFFKISFTQGAGRRGIDKSLQILPIQTSKWKK